MIFTKTSEKKVDGTFFRRLLLYVRKAEREKERKRGKNPPLPKIPSPGAEERKRRRDIFHRPGDSRKTYTQNKTGEKKAKTFISKRATQKLSLLLT